MTSAPPPRDDLPDRLHRWFLRGTNARLFSPPRLLAALTAGGLAVIASDLTDPRPWVFSNLAWVVMLYVSACLMLIVAARPSLRVRGLAALTVVPTLAGRAIERAFDITGPLRATAHWVLLAAFVLNLLAYWDNGR